MSITIDEAIKQARAMARCVGKNSDEYELLAATNAAGLIKPRIHNEGKDAEGNTMSAYSKGHKRKRQKNIPGLQTSKKDLQFTDQLFDAEQIFKFDGQIIFGIKPGDRAPLKPKRATSKAIPALSNIKLVEFLEENEGTEIFAPSKAELKLIDESVDKAINKDLDKCFNQFPPNTGVAIPNA